MIARRLAWLAAAGFAVVQAVWALCHPFDDLRVYQGAVRAMWHGDSLYSFVAANGDPFTYPPFAGLVLAPVTLPGVAVVWTLLTFGVVLWCAVLVGRWWPPLVFLVLLASAPVARDLRFGQLSIFLVLLVLLDGLDRVPEGARGIATGVAAAIKLTPLVFIPYFWLAGQRRVALTAGATFAGCTVGAWLLLPGDSVRYWFTELWHTDRIGNLALTGNQSLNGMLLRSGLPAGWVRPVWAVLAVVVVGAGLVRAARASRNGYPLVGLAIAGAVGVMVSPVSWTHHQIWLVFAAAGTVGTRPAVRWGWVVAVLAIMTVPTGVENLRGPLALAVAVAVPFAEVTRGHRITAHADRTDDHPRPRRAGGGGIRLPG